MVFVMALALSIGAGFFFLETEFAPDAEASSGEMTDQGLCLSMHQPHASLLVAGLKVHEGRTWYSAHRGRWRQTN